MRLLPGLLATLAWASLVAVTGCGDPVDPIEPDAGVGDELVRQELEPPGRNCPRGGTATHRGLDDNRDGLLQDDEIDATAYVCAGADADTWLGDFTAADWLDPAKVRALERARVVTGSLTIVASATTSLPRLAQVAGTVAYQSTTELRTPLTVPALRTIGGDLVLANVATEGLAMPALRTIAGDLTISSAMPSITLDRLASVGGGVLLVDRALTTLALPRLATIGGSLTSLSTARLETLELASLRAVGGHLQLSDAAQLRRVSFPLLATVRGEVSIRSLARLDALELPALTGVDSWLSVTACPQLRAIELPRLADVTALSLTENARVETVAIPAVALVQNLHLEAMPALRGLGLDQLGAITNELRLRSLGLADLTGLRGVRSVSHVVVDDLDQLPDLRGPSWPASLKNVQIRGCAALTSLAGSDGLVHIDGDLLLQDNPVLASLAGLESVSYVGGALGITSNPVLSDLAGLSGLSSIGGGFELDAPALVSLAGLDALQSLGGQLVLGSLPGVPPAELDAFRARVGR